MVVAFSFRFPSFVSASIPMAVGGLVETAEDRRLGDRGALGGWKWDRRRVLLSPLITGDL